MHPENTQSFRSEQSAQVARAVGTRQDFAENPGNRMLGAAPRLINGDQWRYAQRFSAEGFSVIPIRRDGSKAAAVPWAAYQRRYPTQAELRGWFERHEPYGIAIVHGAISQNSEVVDVDDDAIAADFYTVACREIPSLINAPWIETPRPGHQWCYRNANPPPGNLKLAEYLNPDWSEGATDVPRWKTKIETRGEGGYTVALGSPACCHQNNKTYRLLAGSFRTIPILTADERDRLHGIARSYDERRPGIDRDHRNLNDQTDRAAHNGDRPGDDFNRSVIWSALLQPHGWRLLYTTDGVGHWCRPGKKRGVSATTNYGGHDLLYVFSSNAYPFDAERGYGKFGAFALLEHGGNFTKATHELHLRREGR